MTRFARLAGLSRRAHALAARQPPEGSEPSVGLDAIEAQVDQATAELWGITDQELADIRRSLEEME